MDANLNLNGFYPEYMLVEEVANGESEIHIKMRSISKESICPVCGQTSARQNSFHYRDVDDLPILGKPVKLQIAVRLYYCGNAECEVMLFNEYLRDFVNNRGQWTQRCEALIMAVALNMSCEGASRVCKQIGIQASGDTIIHMLLRNTKEVPYAGDSVGVDDWAYRKGNTYGTLICDIETRKPIALFPEQGRRGAQRIA